MALQRVDGGNTIYFLGQVRGSGGWIYFPVLFLLKEPIPTLIIVFLALVLALWWMIKKTIKRRGGSDIKQRILDYLTHSTLPNFRMASFVVLYWGYSMHSPLNIGIRHLMPTIPLIFILAAGVWKKWIMQIEFRCGAGHRRQMLHVRSDDRSRRRDRHKIYFSDPAPCWLLT